MTDQEKIAEILRLIAHNEYVERDEDFNPETPRDIITTTPTTWGSEMARITWRNAFGEF